VAALPHLELPSGLTCSLFVTPRGYPTLPASHPPAGLQIRLWRIKDEYDRFFLWRCAPRQSVSGSDEGDVLQLICVTIVAYESYTYGSSYRRDS